MSLHINISDEAQKIRKRQQLKATVFSIGVSFLSIVGLALILGLFLLPNIVKETPVIVSYTANLPQNDQVAEKKTPTKTIRKPSAATNSMAKVIAAKTESPTAVPIPDNIRAEPSLDLGDGQDFGQGYNEPEEIGGGEGFKGLPVTMRKRCSVEDRMARLRSEGGTEQGEAAIIKALDWMQRTQRPDGSWTPNYPVSMTGLSLLAYLGHCETPQSAKYGETVLKAITYLTDFGMKNNGRLSNKADADHAWVYEHGIATYALAEAYTFCNQLNIKIPDLDTVLIKAGNMIIEGQNRAGGWVYGFQESEIGDNSVGFWMIQALKACKHTGLWKETELIHTARKALSWIEKVQGKDGTVGYNKDPNRSPGLTSGAVVCFQLWDRGNSKTVADGIKWLSKNTEFVWNDPPVNHFVSKGNMYYHYYNVQAFINHGGEEWKAYNLRFRDNLIKAQNPDGTWTSNNRYFSNHMVTCLSALALEAYYRFLPGTGER